MKITLQCGRTIETSNVERLGFLRGKFQCRLKGGASLDLTESECEKIRNAKMQIEPKRDS